MELTLRDLNRTLLARQLLLERARVPVARAIERVGPIQAQYIPSPYVALWSRLDGFEKAQLTRALHRGAVVQHGNVRGTLHLTSRGDFDHYAASYVAGQLPRAERIADLAKLRRAIGDEPVTNAEVRERARPLVDGDDEWPVSFALRGLPWIRVHPAGTWGSPPGGRARLWNEPLPSVEDATLHTVRRYLTAFGPATRKDVQHFLGFGARQLAPALERMRRAGDGLYDVPRGRFAPGDAPAPPRFLHSFDSAYLAHDEKARICAPEYEDAVYLKKNATMKPIFLVDGFVAGTWKIARTKAKATLTVSPFAPLPRGAKRDVLVEAERLVRWYEDEATSYAVSVAAPA